MQDIDRENKKCKRNILKMEEKCIVTEENSNGLANYLTCSRSVAMLIGWKSPDSYSGI